MVTKHNRHWIIAHEFIHEQGKDPYCHQASFTVNYRIRRLTTTGMSFCFVLHELIVQYRKLFLRHYIPICYITRIKQYWCDIQVKKHM